MGSIRGRLGSIGILGLLVATHSLYGQQANPRPLGEDMQTIERTLRDPKTSGAARYAALVRLGDLSLLSGNIEAAADAWNKAALQGVGGRMDGNSMLASARCFIALGALDKADTAIRMALLTGTDSRITREGRYLGCISEAVRSGNAAPLRSLLEDPEFGDYRSAVLYILWKVTGEGAYQNRLKTDHPLSIEARMVRDGGGPVTGAPKALWLLLPGRSGITLAEPQKIGPSAGTAPPASQAADGALTIIQAGLFSREENAAVMVERLRKAGFSPFITQRRVRDTAFFAVSVPPGDDMNTTIIRLKEAGIEAFPVFIIEGSAD